MLRGGSQTSGVSLIAFLCSPGFPGRQKGPGTSEGEEGVYYTAGTLTGLRLAVNAS